MKSMIKQIRVFTYICMAEINIEQECKQSSVTGHPKRQQSVLFLYQTEHRLWSEVKAEKGDRCLALYLPHFLSKHSIRDLRMVKKTFFAPRIPLF